MARFSQFYLGENRSSSMPTRMVFYDCETKHITEGKEQHHRMKLGWTCYCRRKANQGYTREAWHYHTETESLCNYISGIANDNAVLYVFGHNVFFDMQSSDIFYWFTKWGWILDFTFDKGITYLLIIHKGKTRIKFVSTTNYFSYSLKRIGDLIGCSKQDVNFETVDDAELSIYCKRDVEITKLAMDQYFGFLESHDLGRFGLTKSSQALNAFRHRFMHVKIGIHKDEQVNSLERDSYTGGRVECFQIGKIKRGPFVSLDINSMYPYIMATHELPTRLVDYAENPPIDRLQNWLKKFCIIANVDITTNQPVYPYRMNDKLVFPIGRFNVTLCTPALLYALEHNHILKIHTLALYEKAVIFKDYVDYFYALRKTYEQEGNDVYATLSKYLLNTLYGKFGQKKALVTEAQDVTYDGYWRVPILNFVTGLVEMETKLFNKKTIQYGEANGSKTFVAIPAHITEYGRMLLWQIIQELEVKNVLYCDTDAIKIRQSQVCNLHYPIEPKRLGALSIDATFSNLTIYGPKDYETEDEIKLKGVPKTAEMIKPGCYRYLNFMGQSTHLRRKITRYFIVKEITKTNKRIYNKGIVTSSGRVIPFSLDDI